ncbi:MAG: glucose-methanol-choline oxidoreductase [Microbacteriaceae bacterium]|nr:MAG: glucose-methanol-choline oxidoreductase [Microbacteriaceae bacterium]
MPANSSGELFTATIRAAVDRIIPADRWPGGWDGGVAVYVDPENPDLGWAAPSLRWLNATLDAAARAVGVDSFAALAEQRQDAILAALETTSPDADGDAETGDTVDPAAGAAHFAALRRICWEGFYAASDRHRPIGLEMVGFRAVPDGVTPVEPDPIEGLRPEQVRAGYDAIVIGSGPGGGVAADTLTKAGRTVLLIERALPLPNAALRGDHLHGKRNAVYWPSAGPGLGHPRLAHLPDGEDRVIDGTGDASLYGLNAMVFGGGTRLWQGMAWRFLPQDFEMKSRYGNPDGASLVDWPIGYDELEPYYTRAERELGVCGAEGDLTSRTPRSAGYPMPPMPTEPARERLGAAAEKLGWGWGPIPLAINSVPHDGRPACVLCPQCVGHACPVNAKNGSNNTFIPRAVATGLCDVLYDAEVIQVRDGASTAGVTIMASASSTPTEIEVNADVVVVSAGAVETPRLLLASGIGNDQLGRNLHDHRFVTVLGTMDEAVKQYIGPGHSVATLDHVHGRSIPWGGGVIVDLMSLLPLTSASHPASTGSGPGVPLWGAGHKEWMRGERSHAFGVFGMGQEIPMASSRVALAPDIHDRWGKPAAALRKDVHWASVEVEDGLARQGAAWLHAAGARDIRRQLDTVTASAAGEHSSGTARMGTSPEFSATDAYGRVHGAKRIVVCDASLHPTNGSVNPTLTIVANAMRISDRLVQDWPT